MAEDQEKAESAEPAEPAKKVGFVKRILQSGKKYAIRCMTPKIMVGTLIASIPLHGLVFWSWSSAEKPASREVSLGRFEFFSHAADSTLANRPRVLSASFDLHISLLRNVDARARELIRLRAHKLRQAVEELIRQARDRELADPELSELKRRLLAQINHTLGLKAVDEVLITQLRLEVADLHVESIHDQALDAEASIPVTVDASQAQ